MSKLRCVLNLRVYCTHKLICSACFYFLMSSASCPFCLSCLSPLRALISDPGCWISSPVNGGWRFDNGFFVCSRIEFPWFIATDPTSTICFLTYFQLFGILPSTAVFGSALLSHIFLPHTSNWEESCRSFSFKRGERSDSLIRLRVSPKGRWF